MTRSIPYLLLAGFVLSLSIFVADGCAGSSSSDQSQSENGGLDGGFCGTSTMGSCSADTDCMTDGCSSQVCRSANEPPMITTCEWVECYDATKYSMACGCVENQCQWKDK